jgi:hypothetical protein
LAQYGVIAEAIDSRCSFVNVGDRVVGQELGPPAEVATDGVG